MGSNEKSFEQARVEVAKVDDWCMANVDEVERMLNLDIAKQVSTFTITKALHGSMALALMAGGDFAKVANFCTCLGYYLAKNHDQGTKVPDIFKED